ncbi:hypothetical protein ACFVVA_13200 [Kitasatospora sp. NPDC058048]|uniref:hypothetical protein n=1 Tax=Kitasatospora sp. NPDC058048 TaxID=3346313 RepID=UPI0036D7F5B7
MTEHRKSHRRSGALAALVLTSALAGCGGGADEAPAEHTNRIHTGSEARPDYWVRAPYDRYALLVEESSDAGGSKRWRGVVRAYTPAKRGEGALKDVLWRDDTLYDSGKDQPEYRWQAGGGQVWIFTDRHRAAVGAEDEVRVVEPGPDGVWRSRTLTAGQYRAVPEDVRVRLPEGVRQRAEGGTGTNP